MAPTTLQPGTDIGEEATMKLLRIGLAVGCMLFLAASAFAQTDAKTKQMIDDIKEKVDKISSYTVDMRMETELLGQVMTTDGQMAFKKPNKVYMKTANSMMKGMTQEVFTTGDIVWTYMPEMKMASKVDMSKIRSQGQMGGITETGDITKVFDKYSEDKVKYLESKSVDGTEAHIFEVSTVMPGQMPAGQGTPQMLPHKMHLWIAADTGLPLKILMFAEGGALAMEQTYSNFKIDVPIDDSKFAFTPPSGVQVMDLTTSTMNMMKQMQQETPPAE